ncbi:MAG: phage terminase large subunit [Limnochordia bacterium]|jgi:predicted phage terminase large subunit-like protein
MVDPSLGGSRTADYSAIVTVGRDVQTGFLYVIDAVIERLSPEALMDAIFRCYDRFNHVLIGFETVAFQKVLKLWLDERARKTGRYLPVAEVSQGGLSKEARITRLSPLVENGTIRFSRKVQRLIEQLVHFPKGDHDDGPDALEGAVDLFRRLGGGGASYQSVQRRRFVTEGAW